MPGWCRSGRSRAAPRAGTGSRSTWRPSATTWTAWSTRSWPTPRSADMVVTLLTDYGLGDEFVGVCHGVIARIAPEARVIDVTHGIARHDVRHGALALRNALPHLPAG